VLTLQELHRQPDVAELPGLKGLLLDAVVDEATTFPGNAISDTSRSYTYDALSRLTGLSEGPEQRAYAYNGDGTLISQTVNGATTLLAQDLAAPLSQVLAA
jgi:YD repeat-containing protein